MFGLFKKKSESELLHKKYQQLIEEAYQLSHSNRKASDQKMAEANEVMARIEAIKHSGNIA